MDLSRSTVSFHIEPLLSTIHANKFKECNYRKPFPILWKDVGREVPRSHELGVEMAVCTGKTGHTKASPIPTLFFCT